MRICYLITGLGLGGAERATIQLANEMANRGNYVEIGYLTGNNEHSDIDSRITVHCFEFDRNPIRFPRHVKRLSDYLSKQCFDVIHSQMFHANIVLRLASLFNRLPLIINTEHSQDIRGRGRMLMYRLTNRWSRINTNVAEAAVNTFIEKKAFREKNSMCIYNGIRFPDNLQVIQSNNSKVLKQIGLKDDDFIWLHVGRLTEAKDQRLLLEAFSMCKHGKLIIVGKGELEDSLKDYCQELSLGKRVVFAGAHKDMSTFYSIADCFLLTSAWEGMPMVLVEAASWKLPIISTDVGGCAEIVKDRKWLCETRTPKSYSELMERIYRLDTEQRKQVGIENFLNASNFDITNIANKWEQIYESKDIV